MSTDSPHLVNAIENTVQKNSFHQGRSVYLGVGCPFPENHTVAVIPHCENGIVLSKTAIEKIKGIIRIHEQEHEDNGGIVKNGR